MKVSNNRRLMVVSALVTTLVSTTLPAQEEREPTQKSRPAELQVHLAKHDVLVGAAVIGSTGEEKLGKVTDLVFDPNGQLRHAVVAAGKKQVQVPWGALKWDDKLSTFRATLTKEALESLPEFDAKKLHRPEGSVDHGKASKEPSSGGGEMQAAAQHAKAPDHHMLASKIGDCAVLAGKDQLGSGNLLFIEPTTGTVAFLSVASGGVLGIGESNYLVPWGALRFVKPVGETQTQIQLTKSQKDLESAPKLSDSDADVNKAEFRDKVYQFYGVERPAFEPKLSSTGNE